MLMALKRRWLRSGAVWLLLGTTSFTALSGCSRQFWRRQADRDAYDATREKLNNPHWQLPRIDLNPDRRSRFYDPYDPDCGPLPPDDPAAHEVMHCVSGRRGYKNWHKFGRALSIENPQWLEPFGIAVENADPVIGHSLVDLPQVTLPDSVELAYIHSRDYQTRIEDLYLAALDLTLERFRLGVRYLGTSGREPGSTISSSTNAEGRTNGSLNSNFGVSQLLPTGGQIAVELANSTLWVFGSPGSASASSLSYSLTQPLLFNAGRKIALEPLTQAERDVLYSARTLARFRQTLFVRIATDYLSLLRQKQGILNTENNIRQLRLQVESQLSRDAYTPNVIKVPLQALPQDLEIPDGLQGRLEYDADNKLLAWYGPMTSEDEQQLLSLSEGPLYRGAIQDMITFATSDVASLGTEQLRTQLNSRLNQLASARLNLANSYDDYKVNLGLPPNIQLDIDASLLDLFELISSDLILTEAAFRQLQEEYGERLLPEARDADEPAEVDLETLQVYVQELNTLTEALYRVGMQGVQNDFSRLRDVIELTQDDWSAYQPGVRYFQSQEEREAVLENIEQDLRLYRMSERDYALAAGPLDILRDLVSVDSNEALLERLDANNNGTVSFDELPEEFLALPTMQSQIGAGDAGAVDAQPELTVTQLLGLIRDAAATLREELQRVAQSLQVVQAGVRVETIPLNRFTLPGSDTQPDIEEVVRLGLEFRHDLMNARARVTDARRRVEIAANRLEAALDLEFSGRQSLSAAGPNASNYGASLQFTSPLDMVTERNQYRQALITYQRERRNYMLQEDQVKSEIRQAWRTLQVQQERIQVDRQNVRTVARQYDSASLDALGGNTNALNLLNALDNVLGAQNSLVGDWVSYETSRLNIFRDMGIMEVGENGIWSDEFYLGMDSGADAAAEQAVPDVPTQPADSAPPATETPDP